MRPAPGVAKVIRVLATVLAFGLVAVGCGTTSGSGSAGVGQADGATSGAEAPDTTTAPNVEAPVDGDDSSGESFPCSASPVSSTSAEQVASGIDWLRGGSLADESPTPLLGRDDIVPVLGPDGIPAIDAPRCLNTGDVDFLSDDAPVVVVEIDGDARAYPLEILTWHELVNDTIGGLPVTVSYCPLCNSAIAYDRRVGDRILDFGTSGALHQSSMVMYDRQTQSLWTHFNGQAVLGELTGAKLEFYGTAVVSWATFKAEHPDGIVLSRDTGANRNYGINPYPGYLSDPDPLDERFLSVEVDSRLDRKARVIGVAIGDDAVGIVAEAVATSGVTTFTVGGVELVAFQQAGTASALEDFDIAGSVDVGATTVFKPDVDGEVLTFVRAVDGFVDDQTGSSWSILGAAFDGPLKGMQLEIVPSLDTFWFAWAAFYPDTELLGT